MLSLKDIVHWGYVFKTYGFNGNVIIRIEHKLLDEIDESKPVFLEIEGKPVPFFPQENSIRWKNERSLYFHFKEIDTLEEAEQLLGLSVYILPEMIDTDEEEIPAFLLKNYRLFNQDDELIGTIEELIDIKNNPLLKVLHKNQELLVPYVQEWIIKLQTQEKSLKMKLPTDLLQ